MFINVQGVKKSFGNGSSVAQILRGVDLEVNEGEICVILGPSGSGKSTLLNILGGLDVVDAGRVEIDGQDISKLNSKKLGLYRRNNLGFIFQLYNLIPNLTVEENIRVCEKLAKNPLPIDEILSVLGLTEHKNKFPSMLSGGQQQRCAIGRAVIKNPKILLCDEPTGALDYKTSKEILMLLEKLNKEYGTTMLMVTHNEVHQQMAHRVIKFKDGVVQHNIKRDNIVAAKDLVW